MQLKCCECNVWFSIHDPYDSIKFYTKCPNCNEHLDVEIDIKVTKKFGK